VRSLRAPHEKCRLSGGKADGSNNHDWPDPDIYAGRRTATRIFAFSESALNCLEPGTTNRVVVLSRLPTVGLKRALTGVSWNILPKRIPNKPRVSPICSVVV
jgi:hypothetical protein